MGPWCYVDAKACKYPPLNDTTGQSYGWCENNQSRTTYDTGALPRERRPMLRLGRAGGMRCNMELSQARPEQHSVPVPDEERAAVCCACSKQLGQGVLGAKCAPHMGLLKHLGVCRKTDVLRAALERAVLRAQPRR